ncbi:MAG: translation initiation factor IF-2 [Epsilonproteobacteria bacterium]|nr:translation initiation factor IF-2 [Campylobacterota bacterium]
MGKVRIHEIAKEIGLKSKEVLEKAKEINLEVKSPQSAVTEETANVLIDYIINGVRPNLESAEREKPKESKPKESVQEEQKSESKELKKEEPSKEKEEQKELPKREQKSKEEREEKKTFEKEKKVFKKEKKEEKEKPIKRESLAQASLKKRRGLVIVKKKKPKVAPEAKKEEIKEESPAPKKTATLSAASVAEMVSVKKKKPKKTPAQPKKKEEVKKLDINIEFKDVEVEENDVVVLPDLTDMGKEEEKEQVKKKIEQNRIKTTKKSPFLTQDIKRGGSKKKKKKKQEQSESKEVKKIKIPEEIRVYEFAEKIGKQPSDIIKALFNLGVMVTKNDFLDKDAIEILAEEFDIEVETINPLDEFDYLSQYENLELTSDNFIEKPPVITIMGHVDHGKTSLLDKIRSTKITEREAGGITQHVGAYTVVKNGKKITFIDTPGHEAFTEMRSRGAQATDIAVIVVAADDGVKPQTKEALDHAKAAGVPIVIAVNKIDKPEANPELVKSQLAELGIVPSDWGGEYDFVEVSAKTGQGIDDLLDTLLLQAEVMELKANPDVPAKAIVIESSLEKGRGPVVTVIVQNGTLKKGDIIVCGGTYGRVRALLDDEGKNIKEAGPGEPAVVVGLNEVPNAGDILVAVESEKIARDYAQKRAEYLRQKELSKSTKVTLDELNEMIAEGSIKSLPVIIKADVQGSLEAIKSSLEKLKNEEVKVNIISAGVGGITESDISLASVSDNCVIFGFNVRPTGSVKEKAKRMGIQIKTYNVIYDLIDDVKNLLSGLLSPVVREEALGQAEVREVFNIPKVGTVAGCIVTDGVINRGAKVRLIRDGVVIYESTISSLKRFKDDVREVAKGYECGIGIENFNDIKVGDFIESFKEVEEKATL